MRKLDSTEIRMLSLMYAVRQQDRLTNADLRSSFGIECIGDVVRNSRLRWFACGTLTRRGLCIEVEGKRLRG